MVIQDIFMNNKRYSIYEVELDGDAYFPADQNLIDKYTLIIGKDIEEELNKIIFDSLKHLFSRRALEYHYIRLHTLWEMEKYLKKVWYESYRDHYSKDLIRNFNLNDLIFEVSRIVLKDMVDSELLNDEEFAREFVDSRRRSKPRGKFLLVKELMQKGVDKNLAKKVVDDMIIDESEMVEELLTKRYGKSEVKPDDRKIIRYLKGKGFSWDSISRFIEE